MRWKATSCLCLLMLSGCASSIHAPLPDRRVSEDFAIDGVRWQDGGLMAVFIDTFDSGGKVGVCGAYTYRKDKRSYGGTSFNKLMLETAGVSLAGKEVVSGIGFFNRVAYPESDSWSGTSTCVVTNTPWKPEYEDIKPELSSLRRRVVVSE